MYPFRTSSIEITTDLPCEEEQYERGVWQSRYSLLKFSAYLL
jgi:hypothetical protein